MIWGCMAASGIGRLTLIDSTFDHVGYLNALKENLKTSAQKKICIFDVTYSSSRTMAETHCPQSKALAIVQYQKLVAYSSTIAGLKLHRTFMELIRTQDTAT